MLPNPCTNTHHTHKFWHLITLNLSRNLIKTKTWSYKTSTTNLVKHQAKQSKPIQEVIVKATLPKHLPT
jgi:hypothetical protein